jgi:hypothetical protein
MYSKYLNGSDSEMEVNISGGLKKKVTELYKNLDNIEKLDPQILKLLLNELKINLADTFSRFKFTKLYFNWKLNNIDTFVR